MTIPITGGAAASSGQEQACIVRREDGVWLRTDAQRVALQAAAGAVFLAGDRFDGIDYTAFLHTLYGTGPKLPAAPGGEPLVRVADAIVPFPPARRQLYKSVKIVAGAAEYFFEPVFDETGDREEHRATLSFDEFVADMWVKGIRFGIAADAVREAIDSRWGMRIVVARCLDPVAGRDAEIVEVSQNIHRSNTPRELANGRFDLPATRRCVRSCISRMPARRPTWRRRK